LKLKVEIHTSVIVGGPKVDFTLFLYIVGTNFYALPEHISIHYRSTFYTLLLAAGDAASLIAKDLLVAMYVQIWMCNEFSI